MTTGNWLATNINGAGFGHSMWPPQRFATTTADSAMPNWPQRKGWMMSSYTSTTLSIDSDGMPDSPLNKYVWKGGISIPEDMRYAHVNYRSDRADLTIVVNNPDAAEILAYAILCAADNKRKSDAKFEQLNRKN